MMEKSISSHRYRTHGLLQARNRPLTGDWRAAAHAGSEVDSRRTADTSGEDILKLVTCRLAYRSRYRNRKKSREKTAIDRHFHGAVE